MNQKSGIPKGYRYFHIISMLFVSSLLVGNTVAVKIITFLGFSIPAGILCFPLAYIVNDVLTEVYGYKKTKGVIWWGFICLGFMTLVYYLSTIITPAPFWKDQQAYLNIFNVVPRIALGSLVAFLVGSFLNSIVLSKMKIFTKGKYLWTRTIGSTIIGEGADSIIFNLIAFAGIFKIQDLAIIMFSGFLLKTLYETVATPLTYLVVGYLKRIEQEDKYDIGENYNPF
ncbi:MAG: queuosine precursor transporter [Bacteroidota bacterium]